MASAHPDTDQHSPVLEGDDHLTALPNELLASVVERLPIREICRLRSVYCHLRGFVDTNQGKLTQDLISHHRARINNEYKLLTDLSDCDIVDAMRRYDSHYGSVENHWIESNDFRPFKWVAISLTLYLNWLRSHYLAATEDYGEAETWMTAYSNSTAPSTLRLSSSNFSMRRITSLARSHVWSYGSTDHRALKAKIMETTSTKVHVAYNSVPSCLLTDRKFVAPSKMSVKIRRGRCNKWEISKVERLLNLPESKYKEDSLAYCSMSEHTADLVRKVDQGSLTKLKQVVIIEEIFLW